MRFQGSLFILRALRARTLDRDRARPAAGEGVRSCPRAGCVNRARPGLWGARGSLLAYPARSHGRTTKAPPDERGGNGYVRPTETAPHLDSTELNQSERDQLTTLLSGGKQ